MFLLVDILVHIRLGQYVVEPINTTINNIINSTYLMYTKMELSYLTSVFFAKACGVFFLLSLPFVATRAL